MTRPSRSDARLPAAEEAKIEEETRRYFEDIAPRRHPKPSRSEYSDDLRSDQNNISIPELDKLQNLQKNPQKFVCEGSQVVVDDEYVETEYYKGLNRIDKQHHTTGTGFIKVEKPSENNFDFDVNPAYDGTHLYSPSCRGNPATNEWVPSAEQVIPVSHEPSRSDI